MTTIWDSLEETYRESRALIAGLSDAGMGRLSTAELLIRNSEHSKGHAAELFAALGT